MHLKYGIYTVAFLAFAGCLSAPQKNSTPHPMVDGRKSEYDQLNIPAIKLSSDVNLYIYQNEYYVWVSYDFPEGSFGTLDMTIETEKIQTPLNLHVSAQLGEWPAGDDAKKPKSPTSELWWNIEGWTANNLWVNGIDTSIVHDPQFKIRNGEIREIQLSKSRFGSGDWKIKLNINAIKGKDGKFYSIVFPENETFYIITVK